MEHLVKNATGFVIAVMDLVILSQASVQEVGYVKSGLQIQTVKQVCSLPSVDFFCSIRYSTTSKRKTVVCIVLSFGHTHTHTCARDVREDVIHLVGPNTLPCTTIFQTI